MNTDISYEYMKSKGYTEDMMQGDVFEPVQWADYVQRGLDNDCGSLDVYSHTSDGYKPVRMVDGAKNDLDATGYFKWFEPGWFDIVLEDIDAFYKLCEKYRLVFVWYNK